ncbi:MAG: FAD-dependent monooxygenase, partial [Pseudomonadota bacterium]
MQYHHNGFRPGDPRVAEPGAPASDAAVCDVAIVGCGPAGLTLAAQLASLHGVTVQLLECKSGPLRVGQADGIACRSMEMFEAFGFADEIRREAYWVNETCFWRPATRRPTNGRPADRRPANRRPVSGRLAGDSDTITRADRIQDVADDLSHQPHTILSQARVHDFLLDHMARSPARLSPCYGLRFAGYTRDDDNPYPITAHFEPEAADGAGTTVR